MAKKRRRKRKGAKGTSWLGTQGKRVHVAGYHVSSHYRAARSKRKRRKK